MKKLFIRLLITMAFIAGFLYGGLPKEIGSRVDGTTLYDNQHIYEH